MNTHRSDVFGTTWWLHILQKKQIDLPSGLAAVLNVEFGNRQLHQQGNFSLPLLA